MTVSALKPLVAGDGVSKRNDFEQHFLVTVFCSGVYFKKVTEPPTRLYPTSQFDQEDLRLCNDF